MDPKYWKRAFHESVCGPTVPRGNHHLQGLWFGIATARIGFGVQYCFPLIIIHIYLDNLLSRCDGFRQHDDVEEAKATAGEPD
jgi:hypothetical protein